LHIKSKKCSFRKTIRENVKKRNDYRSFYSNEPPMTFVKGKPIRYSNIGFCCHVIKHAV